MSENCMHGFSQEKSYFRSQKQHYLEFIYFKNLVFLITKSNLVTHIPNHNTLLTPRLLLFQHGLLLSKESEDGVNEV